VPIGTGKMKGHCAIISNRDKHSRSRKYIDDPNGAIVNSDSRPLLLGREYRSSI